MGYTSLAESIGLSSTTFYRAACNADAV